MIDIAGVDKPAVFKNNLFFVNTRENLEGRKAVGLQRHQGIPIAIVTIRTLPALAASSITVADGWKTRFEITARGSANNSPCSRLLLADIRLLFLIACSKALNFRAPAARVLAVPIQTTGFFAGFLFGIRLIDFANILRLTLNINYVPPSFCGSLSPCSSFPSSPALFPLFPAGFQRKA